MVGNTLSEKLSNYFGKQSKSIRYAAIIIKHQYHEESKFYTHPNKRIKFKSGYYNTTPTNPPVLKPYM